jgi:hypothetical protein
MIAVSGTGVEPGCPFVPPTAIFAAGLARVTRRSPGWADLARVTRRSLPAELARAW